MGLFEYDDILLQYDDPISDYDGCLPQNSKYYRVVARKEVPNSGKQVVELEIIQRPEDIAALVNFSQNIPEGSVPSVPAQGDTSAYYRVVDMMTVPGSGKKQAILEKIDKPLSIE